MKQIPILFSTPMVQGILEGRKMQTRRLVKPMRGKQSEWLTPELINSVPHGEMVKGGWQMHHPKAGQLHAGVEVAYDSPLGWVECPYGKPSDLLWVRESFRVNTWMHEDGEVNFRYEADGALSPFIWFEDGDDKMPFNRYWEQSCADLSKAGYEPNEEERYADYDYKALRLRPNIFMPKEAARIWLQVTDVRVERLQDISEEDAKAEGVEPGPFGYKNYDTADETEFEFAKDSYESLWVSINGLESWAANPFVWVISFKVLSITGKPEKVK